MIKISRANTIAKTTTAAGRDYRMDNYKFLLIFLVVFGHILETYAFRQPESMYRTIYQGIYLFHMPAFIFITGYFSKKLKLESILYLIIIYFVFQFIYTQFDMRFIGIKNPKNFWLYPNWILWYLFVIIGYKLITPVIGRKPISILIACIIALAFGMLKIKPVGFLSIMRAVNFYPYFLLGYHWTQSHTAKLTKPAFRLLAVFALILTFAVFTTYQKSLHFDFLLFKEHYTLMGYSQLKGIGLTIISQISALICIISLLILTPSNKIPIISGIGKETLPIYLLHGLLTKYYNRKGIYEYGITESFVTLLTISLILVLVLGSKPVTDTFNTIFRIIQSLVMRGVDYCRRRVKRKQDLE